MTFVCAHCEKLINCLPSLVDGEFLHATCEEQFIKEKEEAKIQELEDACSQN